MKISRVMNLIVPVETESGAAWIHSTPISREIYKAHFLILSKTFAAIFTEGLGTVAGPRVACLMLEKIASESGGWDGANGVRNTLVGEIIRLSNLVYPQEGKGWQTKPLDVAIEKGVVELDEIIGELVFFTCVSAINKPDQARGLMEVVAGLWSSATTSLSLMDWIDSLVISKPTGNSGEMENMSLAISSTTVPV
ncbi:hypothetical protein N5923_21765 [Erwiniaceae bacterium BAC15a-03b]|uniref:Uncharacterized protein n=1 Tax=Winslowiella arboricola TaxID=2978220 RepID=A0A9J6PUG5_9GAMM|nr:hypothetical protein [Winslowiella arboricola]MCU5774725.1 hypothetical protein [Winslowiella arboricola]MCU5780123.1 hypothetical protein [Winslowiella arboricola]